VTIVDTATTWIDVDVTIGRDTVIQPGTQLLGTTRIGGRCQVGPDTTLTDVTVGDGASVIRTHGTASVIGDDASVGPFTYLRPGTVLGQPMVVRPGDEAVVPATQLGVGEGPGEEVVGELPRRQRVVRAAEMLPPRQAGPRRSLDLLDLRLPDRLVLGQGIVQVRMRIERGGEGDGVLHGHLRA
jgi:serine acetyltransferase